MDWFKAKITQIKNERSNIRNRALATKVVIIGTGKRSKIYAEYADEFSSEIVIVGVVDASEDVRFNIKNAFNLDDKFCFNDWQSLCKVEKFADCVIIGATEPDNAGMVAECVKRGYHILLENPIIASAEACKEIYKSCLENEAKLVLCPVMRYHPAVRKIKKLIDSGVIGNIVNISLTAPVAYWYFAHSFIRGKGENTLSFLSSGHHDVDLISFWMPKVKCKKISSFGSLLNFRKENKPDNAGDRCLQCEAEPECPYSAKKLYLNPEPDSPRFPMSAVCDIEDSDEGYLFHLTKATDTGPYGKCAYDVGPETCDNQVVNFQFDNGATASLTLVALGHETCSRKAAIYGTLGEVKWEDSIHHFDHLTDTTTFINCEEENAEWAHGASDLFTVKSFLEGLLDRREDLSPSGPLEYLTTLLLIFAADHSRVSGQVVDFEQDVTWTIA